MQKTSRGIFLGLMVLGLVSCAVKKPEAPKQVGVADLDKCVRLKSVAVDTACFLLPDGKNMACNGSYIVTLDCYRMIQEKQKK